MKGTRFYFPFSAFGSTDSYVVVSNTTTSSAFVQISVTDAAGVSKRLVGFTVPAKGVKRSWEYLGSIQEIADLALLKIWSDKAVVAEAVRWEESRRGWGFALLPQ